MVKKGILLSFGNAINFEYYFFDGVESVSVFCSRIEELKDFFKNSIKYYDEQVENTDYFFDDDGNEIEDEYEIKRIKNEISAKRNKLKEIDFYIESITVNSYNENIIDIIKEYKDELKYIDFGKLDVSIVNSIISKTELKNTTLIKTKYNEHEYSSIEEFYEAFEYINNIRDYIMQFDFSDLEKCIFLYDLIRERKYKSNENEDDIYVESIEQIYDGKNNEYIKKIAKSRSLMETYKSEEIVCAGFSKIYIAVLETLGIKSEEITFYNETEGHSSVALYLNDKKYKETGVIEVDPTWGRVEKENEYDYQNTLKRYSYFGRPINNAIRIKEKKDLFLAENKCSLLNGIYYYLRKLNDAIEHDYPNFLKRGLWRNLYVVLRNVNQEMEIDIFNDILDELESNMEEFGKIDDNMLSKIKKKMDYTFTTDSFIKALNKVKYVEVIINSDKYPYSIDNIYEALGSKYKIDEVKNFILLERILGNDVLEIDYDTSFLEDMSLYNNPVMGICEKGKIRGRK